MLINSEINREIVDFFHSSDFSLMDCDELASHSSSKQQSVDNLANAVHKSEITTKVFFSIVCLPEIF